MGTQNVRPGSVWNLSAAEASRQQLTRKLEEHKEERHSAGQFQTDIKTAQPIADYSFELLNGRDNLSVLEPAVGSGAFVSACLKFKHQIVKIVGTDIDEEYLSIAKSCFKDRCCFLVQDFLTWKSKEKFDLIISNPPYVRHHLIEESFKNSKAINYKNHGINFSKLSDYYCYFMLDALNLIAENGVLAWLVPGEFLSVGYGKAIRKYLLLNYTIKRIHIFDDENVLFSDALVSNCVIWIENNISSGQSETVFTFGESIEHPSKYLVFDRNKLETLDKWNISTIEANSFAPAGTIGNRIKLKDIFKTKRGIATGDNNFFILKEDEALSSGIDAQFLKPILPSARFVKVSTIHADENGIPTNVARMFLIDCCLTKQELEANYPSTWAYLASGLESAAKGYICKNRKLWYYQEQRKPPLFFFTYMGRNGKDKTKKSFRFISNESNAIANNSFILIYPTEYLERLMSKGIINQQRLYNLLQAIPDEEFEKEGRSYGGGLKKVEPKELLNISIDWPFYN